jgi:hypothetical protein
VLLALFTLWLGQSRNEIVLILIAAIFLATLAYCFLAVLLQTLLYREKVGAATLGISGQKVDSGAEAALSFSLPDGLKPRFFSLPGTLIRGEIRLETKDKRLIHHIFDPNVLHNGISSFPARFRGAYYEKRRKNGAPESGFIFFDAPGFFAAFVPKSVCPPETPALLVLPEKAAEALSVHILSDGEERRTGSRFLRTDNLIEHRPYMPGDDPRRINWKLYGHLGDLFVREGEREPPPHSRITILVDAQADSFLFGQEAAQRAVDMLCGQALALAIACTNRGMEVRVGCLGENPPDGEESDVATMLAYPAALPLFSTASTFSKSAALALGAVLLLALPRDNGTDCALSAFLKNRPTGQTVNIIFLYDEVRLDASAEICVRLYNQKSSVRALRICLAQTA